MSEAAALDQGGARPARPIIRRIAPGAPVEWLRRGWQDMVKTRFRGSLYGILFVLMGYTISSVYSTRWQLTMGLIAGFFLVGPFLACGIYELSRQLQRGERLDVIASLLCWQRNPGSIGFFGIMLTFAMIIWARVSLIVFALFSTTEFPTLQRLLTTVFSTDNLEFLLVWTVVGFVFASIVFAIGVISAPLMLDRRTDTMTAVIASVQSLLKNPAALYFWAVLIVLIVGASLLLGFVPLIITAPLVGHATWHAYEALVDWTAGDPAGAAGQSRP